MGHEATLRGLFLSCTPCCTAPVDQRIHGFATDAHNTPKVDAWSFGSAEDSTVTAQVRH